MSSVFLPLNEPLAGSLSQPGSLAFGRETHRQVGWRTSAWTKGKAQASFDWRWLAQRSWSAHVQLRSCQTGEAKSCLYVMLDVYPQGGIRKCIKNRQERRWMPPVHLLCEEVRLIRKPGLGGDSEMYSPRPTLSWGCQAIDLGLVPVGKFPNNTNVTFLWHATVSSHYLPCVRGGYEVSGALGHHSEP